MKETKMPTMSDVAKAAGVSRATASYALRDDPRIIRKTAQKVKLAAKQLHYKTNLPARSLRSGHSGVIGVAIFELDKPYPSEMSAAISREALRHGLQAIIQQTASSKEREIDVLQKITSQLCDGTIFSPSKVSAEEIKTLSGGKPIVLLDDISVDPLFDGVFTPCESGAKAAIQHLLSIGCKKIMVMGVKYDKSSDTKKNVTVSGRRLSGALDAFKTAGILVDSTNFLETNWNPSDARKAIHQVLDSGRSFDGIFCMTDSMALGALRGLADYGLKVPDDVALIGFDGINEDEYSVPSLSTIQTDLNDLAKKTIQLLILNIENEKIEKPVPQRLTAKFKLIQRESTTI